MIGIEGYPCSDPADDLGRDLKDLRLLMLELKTGLRLVLLCLRWVLVLELKLLVLRL